MLAWGVFFAFDPPLNGAQRVAIRSVFSRPYVPEPYYC